MKFIPYYDKVIIEPLTKGGIIRTGEAESLQEKGRVIAVGDKVSFLKVGNIVYFDSYGCSKTPADSEGKEYYVLFESSPVIFGKENGD